MRTHRMLVLVVLIGCLLAGPIGAYAQGSPRPRGPAVVTGALIGAAVAVAVTAVAAKKYGDNEGGKFCSACLLQWSVVTVPIGAGLGAGIGFGVASARRSVAISVRF